MNDSNSNSWAYADSISDKIIELANGEIIKPDFCPTQFLAGLLLGLVGFQRTALGLKAPREFIAVHSAATACLKAMAAEMP